MKWGSVRWASTWMWMMSTTVAQHELLEPKSGEKVRHAGQGVRQWWPSGVAEPEEGEKGMPLLRWPGTGYQSLWSLRRVPLPGEGGEGRNLEAKWVRTESPQGKGIPGWRVRSSRMWESYPLLNITMHRLSAVKRKDSIHTGGRPCTGSEHEWGEEVGDSLQVVSKKVWE